MQSLQRPTLKASASFAEAPGTSRSTWSAHNCHSLKSTGIINRASQQCRAASVNIAAFAPVNLMSPVASYPAKQEVSSRNAYTEVKNMTALDKVVEAAGTESKWTCFYVYATWCETSRSLFPQLSKVAADEKLTSKYAFARANISNEDIAAFVIKNNNIRGLPFVCLYKPTGAFAMGLSINADDNMDRFRSNLLAISEEPSPKAYVQPSSGYVRVSVDQQLQKK